MADEDLNDEQDNSAEGALESEDSGNPEDDLDSLMSEMENQQSSPEEIAQSGDLSALVTEKTDSSDDNLDEMLESAAGDSGALGDTPTDEEGVDVKFLLEMPLTMTLEVGRVKLSVNDILSLGQGSVLELHRLVGESLDIFVDGKLMAQGDVVITNEKFAAKIKHVIPPEQRVKQMGEMNKSN
ncbi:MAG: FliM/FliN family flagellar motor switch protein [SAR324 cluster bacterium]|nr:FliM/FliN family flagellar motor switch protein [SAR324 cluster bacterium]MBL7034478.1 FliM/FliN family flagellar motor switch protein [SAR324 cluster bacterium]